MPATAQNDSWKPTSNNQAGCISSIRKAVAASELGVSVRSERSEATDSRLNMLTARTTDGESPVSKAKSHITATMASVHRGFRLRRRRQRGVSR